MVTIRGIRKIPQFAAKFDGATGAVVVNANATTDSLTTLTVIADVDFPDEGENGEGRIYEKGGQNTFKLSTTQALAVAWDFSITDGAWETNASIYNFGHHVMAFTYDNTSSLNNPILYIDGNSVTVNTNTPPAGIAVSDSGRNIFIGNEEGDTRCFLGFINWIAFYNVILAAGVIKDLSLGLMDPTTISGCILCHNYRKNNMIDYSNNSNNGSLTGNTILTIGSYSNYSSGISRRTGKFGTSASSV